MEQEWQVGIGMYPPSKGTRFQSWLEPETVKEESSEH